MYARSLALMGVSSIVVFALGRKESVTCSPGTHADKGQCVADVPSNAPTASNSTIAVVASVAPSASAVSNASLAPEKPKPVRNLEAIIAAARDQFRSAHGPLESTSDKHEYYKTSLTLEGCERPSIWKRPTSEWNFQCELVPNKKGQKQGQVVKLLHRRIDAMQAAIPADWKITRTRKAEPYIDQFRAVDPTGHIAISAHIVPRVDNSFDAMFEVTWFPTAQTQ